MQVVKHPWRCGAIMDKQTRTYICQPRRCWLLSVCSPIFTRLLRAINQTWSLLVRRNALGHTAALSRSRPLDLNLSCQTTCLAARKNGRSTSTLNPRLIPHCLDYLPIPMVSPGESKKNVGANKRATDDRSTPAYGQRSIGPLAGWSQRHLLSSGINQMSRSLLSTMMVFRGSMHFHLT
jgi:hypothetical protein